MKIHLISFILSFLLFNSINSQSYIPFPDTNYMWVVEAYNEFGQLIGGHQYFTHSKDTFLGKEYTVISQDLDTTISLSNPPFSWHGIRNDTSQKKVYVFNPTANKEFVLYDFSLKIGDTTLDYSGRTITNIDTMIIDGVNHRVFYVDSMAGTIHPIVEGIGGLGGPFEAIYFFEGGNRLRCTRNISDNTAYYTIPGVKCDLLMFTGIQENKTIDNLIKAYPNPFSETITISNKSEEDLIKIEIYSYQGGLIEVVFCNNPDCQIGQNLVQNGLYVLKIYVSDKKYVIRKIQKC